jgi:hypothetical protein
MAKKQQCAIPSLQDYEKVVTFLKAPNELTDDQELETRDWSDWAVAGQSYARIHTTGSRAVSVANQSHQQIDAVIECPWNATTNAVKHYYAIRIKDLCGWVYFHVIAPMNVDMRNHTMRFVCRSTSPEGVM